MGLAEQALRHFKNKPIVIVTTVVESDGLQEVAGVLEDGADDYLLVRDQDGMPTVVNVSHVAWIYEETLEEEEEEQ